MQNPLIQNHLPFDGELYLHQAFYAGSQADSYFQKLFADLLWQEERITLFGKQLLVPRLMAWYGDPKANYQYSGVMHQPLAWTQDLLMLKTRLESICQQEFNSVLANLYRNGQDSMGCHADNEPELGLYPVIASLSFGAQRLLRFRHRQSRRRIDLELGNGDLLIMQGSTQHHWQHELPKTRKPTGVRINLTFRKIFV